MKNFVKIEKKICAALLALSSITLSGPNASALPPPQPIKYDCKIFRDTNNTLTRIEKFSGTFTFEVIGNELTASLESAYDEGRSVSPSFPKQIVFKSARLADWQIYSGDRITLNYLPLIVSETTQRHTSTERTLWEALSRSEPRIVQHTTVRRRHLSVGYLAYSSTKDSGSTFTTICSPDIYDHRLISNVIQEFSRGLPKSNQVIESAFVNNLFNDQDFYRSFSSETKPFTDFVLKTF